jgi:predicted esterase
MPFAKVFTFFAMCLLSCSAFSQPLTDYMDDAHGAEFRQLGGLKTIVIEHDKNAPYIVYLHGWMGDGFSTYEGYLHHEIKNNSILQKFNWLIPESKVASWFPIETEDFRVWERGLKTTRGHLTKMLAQAKVDPAKVIWAGFSQGAITAADFVLHSTVRPLGLMINSGYYFDSSVLKTPNKVIEGVPFFMIHDRSDTTLPLEMTRKLEARLLENKMVGRLQWLRMGHEMHPGFLSKSIDALPEHFCGKSLK